MGFPIKHPAEEVIAGTDWTTAPLGEGEAILTATVEVSVIRGLDEEPESIKSGGAAVNEDGNQVSQRIVGGVPGVVYLTRWVVVTDLPRTLERRVELVVE